MSRSIALGAVALITAGIAPLPSTGAQAQGVDAGDSITVTAPHKRITGRSATGAPIETMEAQSTVYYGDLDLTMRAGQDELNNRVWMAADRSCKWLTDVFKPDPATSNADADCRRDAVKRAQVQVDNAIALGG